MKNLTLNFDRSSTLKYSDMLNLGQSGTSHKKIGGGGGGGCGKRVGEV